MRASKKAFIDDATLLTRADVAMDRVLRRLNELITWSRMKFKAKKSRSLTFRDCRRKNANSERGAS